MQRCLLQRSESTAWDALLGWSFDEAQVHFEPKQAEQGWLGSRACHFHCMLSNYAQELLHTSQTEAVPNAGLQLLTVAGTRLDMLLDMHSSHCETTCMSVSCRAARRQQTCCCALTSIAA